MISDAEKLKEVPSALFGGLLGSFRKLQSRVKQGLKRSVRMPSVQRPETFAHPLRNSALRLKGWAFIPADVIDAIDRLIVRIEAPGLREEDIDVEFYPRALKIRGERRATPTLRDRQFTTLGYGSFCRYVSLPARIDVDHFATKLRDGVLRIELMKLEATPHTASQSPT